MLMGVLILLHVRYEFKMVLTIDLFGRLRVDDNGLLLKKAKPFARSS